MKQSLISILLDKEQRQGLFWNLKRVYFEQVYSKDLLELTRAANSLNERDPKQAWKDFNNRSKYLENVPEAQYLEGALIRLKTFADFMYIDDKEVQIK